MTEAKTPLSLSVATLIPFFKLVKFDGLSYYKASGIYPYGNSPKSVNLAFENCNLSLLTGA